MDEIQVMTDEEAAEKMSKFTGGEVDPIDADALLCEILISLGYVKTVRAFENVGKWYS